MPLLKIAEGWSRKSWRPWRPSSPIRRENKAKAEKVAKNELPDLVRHRSIEKAEIARLRRAVRRIRPESIVVLRLRSGRLRHWLCFSHPLNLCQPFAEILQLFCQ